jgi:hypothetical protein
MDFKTEFEALMVRYKEADPAEIRQHVKDVCKETLEKKKKLQADMERLLGEHPTVSLSTLRKVAVKAWNTKHPEGMPEAPKREVKAGSYQAFVKERMPELAREHPGRDHKERMKTIGEEWKALKAMREQDDTLPLIIDMLSSDEGEEIDTSSPATKKRAAKPPAKKARAPSSKRRAV